MIVPANLLASLALIALFFFLLWRFEAQDVVYWQRQAARYQRMWEMALWQRSRCLCGHYEEEEETP